MKFCNCISVQLQHSVSPGNIHKYLFTCRKKALCRQFFHRMQMLIRSTPGFLWPTERANTPLPCPLMLLKPTQRIIHVSLIHSNSSVTSYGTWFESKREGGCLSSHREEWQHKKGQEGEVQAARVWDSEVGLVSRKLKSVSLCTVCRDINHSVLLFSLCTEPHRWSWCSIETQTDQRKVVGLLHCYSFWLSDLYHCLQQDYQQRCH